MSQDDEKDFWAIVESYVRFGGYPLEAAKKMATAVIEARNYA